MGIKAGPKSRYFVPLPPFDGDVAAWIELVTERGLYPWQAEMLRALHAPDRPRVAYCQMPRKDGKTAGGAYLALAEMCLKPDRHVYAISDSERSLSGALIRELRDTITRSPLLCDSINIYAHHIECPENGSFIEATPNKFAASQSINPHLVIFDEVHLQRHADTWHGFQFAGAAREDALLVGITTPGFDLAGIAHELYERACAGDPDLWALIFEAAPGRDIDDREGWREANPCYDRPGFAESLEYDRRTMPEHDFRRFRLGQWTATAAAWLPHGAWKACETAQETFSGARVVIGFDGSFSRDATALVGATVEPHPQVFVVRVWERGPHQHHSWRVPRHEVTAAVLELAERFDLAELVADASLWASELEEWAGLGVNVLEYPQTATRMRPATARFYECITNGFLRHDGDQTLARHLTNAVLRPNGMIAKPDKDSPLRIDAAVAAIMCYDRASTLAAARQRAPIFVL